MILADMDEIEDHDRGLSHDLPTLLSRRRALGLFGGAGLIATLAACGASDSDGAQTTTSTSAAADTSTATSTSPANPSPSATAAAATSASSPATASDYATSIDTGNGGKAIPEETNGPFPADGSNGVNILTASGIVRSDIRSSFGDADGVAEGVPLTFSFTVVDVSGDDSSGTPVKGAAVYAWHCDRDGNYSMYSDAAREENYLRGVQETDANGTVTFKSIFPACYSGRWPHIHFEIYPSIDDATAATNKLRTSQLALPKNACDAVYATRGYEQSVSNLAKMSLDTDMVFSDGYSLQLGKLSGSAGKGYTATLRVPV